MRRATRVKRWISAGFLGLAGLGAGPRLARADRSTTSIPQGYDLGRIEGPRDLAFGGAQAALGTSTTALYDNPANLPLARVYHFEGSATLAPEARRQSYGAAIVDSSTSRLAGGVGGSWNILDPDGIHRVWTDVRLALAYPLGDRFAVGATGRYLRSDQAISSGPLGQSLASDGQPGGPLFNGFTFDAGATVVPADGLKIGVVGHNLTNPGVGIAPTTLQGGIGFTRAIFAIEADALADFTTWKSTRVRSMVGGEAFLADRVPLRLGYRYDDGMKTHALSGGAGWIDTSWSFEASVSHEIEGEHPVTFVGVSLRFFYNAASSGSDVDTSNQVF